MKTFSFKPYEQGIRTLWFMQFKPQGEEKKPYTDLYIPSPFGNEWFNANAQNFKKDLDNLYAIQEICSEIKNETQKSGDLTFIKYIEKVKNILKEMIDLKGFMKNEDEPKGQTNEDGQPPA